MSFLELFTWSIWEFSRPRKLLTLTVVSLPGPMFALLLRLYERPYEADLAYALVVPLAVYSFTLVLLCVVFAGGVVSSEMMSRTIQFLLTRPVPRWKILLAKWLGAVVIVSLAVMLSCIITALITHSPSGLADSKLSRDLVIIPVGVATYCSLFAMLSVLSTKPWLIAVIFSFAWESWVPLMPGDFQKLSVMSYLHTLSPQPKLPSQGEVIEFLQRYQTEIAASSAWNTLIMLNVIALAIAAAVFMTAEFVPKEEST